ncbi:CRISPR-associated endoribonuclease Cas6 [Hydrotalea sp.]|uniref:CRISPR-associated endoribonuclease Cas6 n=1 Tax=Hydrotalea sp. TaxID=2881279 RepID=UPI00258B6CEA|nr:CRISPR-associated endoribonuclease Cas6 [Hydrotalea sp.]
MQFQLTLESNTPAIIGLNYQYPLSAAIYKIIQQSDEVYARFLHNAGYTSGFKSFKLFTFSNLNIPFEIKGDRMICTTNRATLLTCFHMPDAATHFIKGIFLHQQITIADSRSKAHFMIKEVQLLPTPKLDAIATLWFVPASPLVTGLKNNRGHYDYMSPLDQGYENSIRYNLVEKWNSIHPLSTEEKQQLFETIQIKTAYYATPPRHRLITIKENTPEETKIRGYEKFKIQIKAPSEMLEFAMNAGLGIYNAMGMGCIKPLE